MSDVVQDLVERLVAQCAILSVTNDEAELADLEERRYRALGEAVTRVGDSIVVDGRRDDGLARPHILLVGHLDVVPPTDDDRVPRVEDRADGAVVVGRGTSDMKSGNVAAQAVFEDRELRAASPFDLSLVLYAREEGPADANELADVLDQLTWLADADFAIVLEPTDLEVHAGCLGGLHATVRFTGQAAHSARPWHGENAVTKAGAFLAELHARPPRDVDIDGVAYRDVFTVTQATTSNARNVVPDTFDVNLNFRFAPSRTCDEAEVELRALVGDRAEVIIIDRAAPAPPGLTSALARAFIAAADLPVNGKQAWTDVARFAEIGVPALNFGPGLTTQAHQRGEFVPVRNLVRAHDVLRRFVRSSIG